MLGKRGNDANVHLQAITRTVTPDRFVLSADKSGVDPMMVSKPITIGVLDQWGSRLG
jgi:hypothetical protein